MLLHHHPLRADIEAGWYDVIDDALDRVTDLLDAAQISTFQIHVLRMVHGGLRVEWSVGAPSDVQAAVAEVFSSAQTRAAQTCELCGKPGRSRRLFSRYAVLCEACRAEEFHAFMEVPEMSHPLFLKYPHLFLTGVPEAGFRLQPGWNRLMDDVLSQISGQLSIEQARRFQITQVKEKFGALTIQWGTNGEGPDLPVTGIRDVLLRARQLSQQICQACGAPGVQRRLGAVYTLCEKHAADIEHWFKLREERCQAMGGAKDD